MFLNRKILIFIGGFCMTIQYEKLRETELDTFIEMRICQLREEGAKETIDLNPARITGCNFHIGYIPDC